MVDYPTLLDFPPPVLQAYRRETVIAEKLEALTALGLLNRRMKDYYDLAFLARVYPFERSPLIAAIVATFRHRSTKLEGEPIGLAKAFYADPARTIQWRAFVRRTRFIEDPAELERIVAEIRQFALPVLAAAAMGSLSSQVGHSAVLGDKAPSPDPITKPFTPEILLEPLRPLLPSFRSWPTSRLHP
jgi:hypothetical protein